jgi:hypothetical protein
MPAIQSKPDPTYVEMGECAQFLNFDILFENTGDEDLQFSRIVANVLNAWGELVLRKFLFKMKVPDRGYVETGEVIRSNFKYSSRNI